MFKKGTGKCPCTCVSALGLEGPCAALLMCEETVRTLVHHVYTRVHTNALCVWPSVVPGAEAPMGDSAGGLQWVGLGYRRDESYS